MAPLPRVTAGGLVGEGLASPAEVRAEILERRPLRSRLLGDGELSSVAVELEDAQLVESPKDAN